MPKQGKAKGIIVGSMIGIGVGIAAVAVFFLIAFFGSMWFISEGNHNEFVRQIHPSPDGEYQAEVVDYEEGALGGSTYVYVSRVSERTEPCEIGKLYTDKGERVAGAQYGACDYMTITWTDDRHLQILIDYENGNPPDKMDVDLSGEKVQTSGWYEDKP